MLQIFRRGRYTIERSKSFEANYRHVISWIKTKHHWAYRSSNRPVEIDAFSVSDNYKQNKLQTIEIF